jgi:hypothetical protein
MKTPRRSCHMFRQAIWKTVTVNVFGSRSQFRVHAFWVNYQDSDVHYLLVLACSGDMTLYGAPCSVQWFVRLSAHKIVQ